MVIVFFKLSPGSWVEQKISSDQFKSHAGKAPEVCGGIVVNSHNNFRSPVLSGLNFRNEMEVSPAPVSQITDFAINILIY